MGIVESFIEQVIVQAVPVLVLLIGGLAFTVSIIIEVLKYIKPLDDSIPTALLVLIVSLVLSPATLLTIMAYGGIMITWYIVFASILLAFIVALVAMDGWERVTEIAKRFIKK